MRYLQIAFFRKKNGQIDEMVKVAKKLTEEEIEASNVIIDYADRKVEKCIIEGKHIETDFDRMNEYYKKVYPQLVDQLEREASITKQQTKHHKR